MNSPRRGARNKGVPWTVLRQIVMWLHVHAQDLGIHLNGHWPNAAKPAGGWPFPVVRLGHQSAAGWQEQLGWRALRYSEAPARQGATCYWSPAPKGRWFGITVRRSLAVRPGLPKPPAPATRANHCHGHSAGASEYLQPRPPFPLVPGTTLDGPPVVAKKRTDAAFPLRCGTPRLRRPTGLNP